MQLTGKLASGEPELQFLLSVPQPHALSLSSDANKEIFMQCALTQGDQTHWSAFSRRQSLSLMFLLFKCLSPFKKKNEDVLVYFLLGTLERV